MQFEIETEINRVRAEIENTQSKIDKYENEFYTTTDNGLKDYCKTTISSLREEKKILREEESKLLVEKCKLLNSSGI
jgi:hypothetical protein